MKKTLNLSTLSLLSKYATEVGQRAPLVTKKSAPIPLFFPLHFFITIRDMYFFMDPLEDFNECDNCLKVLNMQAGFLLTYVWEPEQIRIHKLNLHAKR